MNTTFKIAFWISFTFILGASFGYNFHSELSEAKSDPKFEQRIDSVYIEQGEQKTIVFIYQTIRKCSESKSK